MQLIPIEKFFSKWDSIRKARKGVLIQKGRTIDPDGLQGRSQKKLMTEAMSMEDLWLRQSVHGWVLFLGFKSVYTTKVKEITEASASVGLLLATTVVWTSGKKQFIVSFYFINSQVHRYDTRIASNYRAHSCRTNIKEFTILYQGHRVWNCLPASITNLSTFFAFKNKVLEFY